MASSFTGFREKINLKLYESKNKIIFTLRFFSTFLCFLSIASILYHYGFPPDRVGRYFAFLIVKTAFAVFTIKFVIKIFYNIHPQKFIQENKLESFLILFLFLNLILVSIFGNSIYHTICNFLFLTFLTPYLVLGAHLYLILIIIIEIGKGSQFLSKINISPGALLIYSFIILIFSGSALLMLPEMTIQHHNKTPIIASTTEEGSVVYSTNESSDSVKVKKEPVKNYKYSVSKFRYVDALFTSTSACCVTGLTSVETVEIFSTKGRFIIMLLIQFGGLSIISFATFFASFLTQNQGIRYQALLKDFFNAEKISDTRTLLRRIIYLSLFIEIIGSIALYFAWRHSLNGYPIEQKIFYSVFHSVSAFNNAGFALFTNNLFNDHVKTNYTIHIIIIVLIVLGGLGFIVMEDLIKYIKSKFTKKNKLVRLTVGSKIVLFTTLSLIIVGSVGFYFLEVNNSLAEFDNQGKIVGSIFQSVSTRTCGFNTVDFSCLNPATLLMMIVLMYIGASPGSTGGGIKTTTFAIIIKSAIAIVRGEKSINIFKHTLSPDLIYKSYILAFFSIVLIIFSLFILSFTQSDFDFLKALFEEVSAFGTVGLSTGITPALTDGSKIIIIITMFVGRVGPLTLAMLLRKSTFPKVRYPNANIMIG